ncbi:MAG: CopD family protein [Polyangiaceae bacterium]
MSWLPDSTLLVAAHVLANVVWIGALLAVALLVGHAPWTADPAEVGRLARRVHVRLAAPAFFLSFAAGALRIALTPTAYAHLYWMHAKLTFALVVIVLHHVIGARAKRVADGKAEAAAGVNVLGIVTFVCAAGAVLLGVAKALP